MAGTKMQLNRYGGTTYDYIEEDIVITQEYLNAGHGLDIILDHYYVPGMNQLDVYFNGERLALGGGYEEIDNRTIRLNLGTYDNGIPIQLQEGDEVYVRIWLNRDLSATEITGLDRLRFLRLEEEILNARRWRDVDQSYKSLDDRLDYIQNSVLQQSKTIVFVFPRKVRVGYQGVEIMFPYSGVIEDVYASCRLSSSSSTIIDVEKIPDSDYESGINWKSIFTVPLVIDGNSKSSRTSSTPYQLSTSSVDNGDHFRINIVSVGDGLEDLTVEVVVRLEN